MTDMPAEDRQSMLEADVEKAAAIHYGFLPDSFANEFLDIAVYSRPFGRIGGDFCSIFPMDKRRIVLCMCDATGHGVASALFAARINTYVLDHAARTRHPCMLIDSLNRFLCQRLSGTGMFSSIYTIYIDMEQRRMDFAGAAHPPVLHYQAETGEIAELASETTFIGIEHPLITRCSVNRRPLLAGDKILLYTDGVTDIFNERHEAFGIEGIKAVLGAHHGSDSRFFNKALVDSLMRHGGGKTTDDIMLMSVSIRQ